VTIDNVWEVFSGHGVYNTWCHESDLMELVTWHTIV